MIKPNTIFFVALISIIMNGLISCGSTNKDETIKADLATKAESQIYFAGVTFTVENGVVALNGQCATEMSKSAVESTAKGLYGVKDVVNNIQIAPVILGTDHLLKHGVDSVLKQYATVEAITKDSIVYLEGKIDNRRVDKLTTAISQLKPRMIENKLTLK